MAVDAEVPYQALYRRFRPQRFSDVLGQEHVTRALRAAVRDSKVAHAYLFSGPRGTGKTSTARILAMALNCEHPEDGEPCGACGSCTAIRTGVSLDVQELDSATNRGIDEMRDLLSRVALGTPGRWKVYIVDEVHQITSAAASALLKTLEEPPGHVVFVLATTDPQKVLETIRSRTQHFEFRLLPPDILSGLLSDVAARAALDLPPDAIDVVVRRGHGSARDALSALDQVAAAGAVEDDTRLVGELVDALVARDAGGVLMKVAEGAASGLDPRRLATEVLQHLRDGFLATRAPSLVLRTEGDVGRVTEQAVQMGAAGLVRAMERIGQALIDMRDSADARTTLEVALVQVAAPELDDGRAALLERIERLEGRLAGSAPGPGPGSASGRAPAVGPGEAEPAADPEPRAAAEPEPPRPAAEPEPPRPAAEPEPPRPAAAGASGVATSRPGTFARPARPDRSGRPGPTSPVPARGPAASLGPPPSMPGPRSATGAVPADGPRPGPPERAGVAGAGTVPPGADPTIPRAVPEPPVSSRPGPPPDRSAGGAAPAAVPVTAGPPGDLPSREELTVAWGDRVLASLRPGVKVYVANGRFLPGDGGSAVYALKDRGLLARAEANRQEIEKALSSHFGRPIPLELVLDDAAPPLAEGGSAMSPAPDDESVGVDWAEMEEAPAAVRSPEQRLLEAFPGAEEVDQ